MASEHNRLKLLIATTTNDSLKYTLQVLYGSIKDPECEKVIILSVNNLLTSSKSRSMGLELVRALVPHCSLTIISENASHWCNHCMIHEEDSSNKELKLSTLVEIVKHSDKIESFHKKFSTDYLATILKACLKFQHNAEKVSCLKCLSVCMGKYPNWFGNHKPKIEQILINCLENPNENAIQDASITFLCFLQTGSAGASGANHVRNFSVHFKKLCATVHTLYDSFFEGISEIDDSLKIDEEPFQFSSKIYDSNAEKKLETTANRIMNCLVFIKTMISKRFSVEKQITPKHVLDVVNRGLAVHVCTSKSKRFIEKRNQTWLLNKIQIYLFKLLRLFVIRYHQHLLPFSYVIKNIFLNSLRKTQSSACCCFDIHYKTDLYKTLATWLSLRNGLNESHFHEVVIPIILKDITPFKKNIVLNIALKKDSKAIANQTNSTSNSTNDRDPTAVDISEREVICIYSLETLKWLMASSFAKMSPPLLQQTFNLVIKTLTELQYADIVPFQNATCHVKLYEVLIAFCKRDDANVVSSLHLIINVLSRGLNSSNWEISKVANEGLHLLEKISHPVCKSLNLPDSNSFIRRSDPDDLMAVVHEESVSEMYETLDTNTRQKEIHIISDIVISEAVISNGGNEERSDHEDDAVEEIVVETKSEEINEIIDIEDEEFEDVSCKVTKEVVTVESVISDEPMEQEKAIDNEDTRNSFEDMCLSFQDVVQD